MTPPSPPGLLNRPYPWLYTPNCSPTSPLSSPDLYTFIPPPHLQTSFLLTVHLWLVAYLKLESKDWGGLKHDNIMNEE